MGFARMFVIGSATTAIACGSLLGFGEDDPAPAPPAPSSDSGSDVLDEQPIAPPEDAGTDATDAARDARVDGGKIVFVSSTTMTAKLDGGADGANALCNDLAKAAGITGRTFVAYLFLDGLLGGSYTGTGLTSNVGWFLENGKRAFGPGILGPILFPENALAIDEHGLAIDASAGAWVGSAGGLLGTGLFGANTCKEWDSTQGNGRVGDPSSLATWRDDDDRPCSGARHVYCFEQ